MTVTVTKSPLVNLTSASEKALENIIARLEQQSEHVKEVTVMSNFSIDKLASLQHQRDIVRE